MSYTYKTLTQDEMDDMLVNTLKAQERDLFAHETNKERCLSILKTAPAGEFKDSIKKFVDDTESRISDVSAIITALTPQLPPQERIDASMLRLAAQEATVKSL